MSLFLHLYLLPLCDSTSRQSQGGKPISFFSPSLRTGLGSAGSGGGSVKAGDATVCPSLVPVPPGAHPLPCTSTELDPG